jgi:hypothetical protein
METGHQQHLPGKVINSKEKAMTGWRDPRAWIAKPYVTFRSLRPVYV